VKPRVLFLSHAGVLGGAELALLDIAAEYRDTSEVLLFADGPFRTALTSRGVITRMLPARALHRVRRETIRPRLSALVDAGRVALRVAHAARDYDLVYANSQKAFVVACAAGLVSQKPVVWGLHDLLNSEHFSRFNVKVVVALANRLAARVVANSHASADAFVRQGGDPEKVHVVYNGIDASPFLSITDAKAARFRDALGLRSAPLVGVFGRLSPWKGQHILIDALAMIPDLHALVVGDALFGEVEYAAELRARAHQRGVSERTHFLGFSREIPLLMKVVDVVVHTSTSAEAFGRVIVEGMLAGKPVVATQAGGAVEILTDGTGVLVPTGDATALVEALRDLLGNACRARLVAESGKKRALTEFSLGAMLDGVSRNIEAVVRP
jgi:glycosyltransferase involved in cell wall biosynthesis